MSGNSNKLKIIALYSISIFYVMLRFCEFAKKITSIFINKKHVEAKQISISKSINGVDF